MYTVIIGARCIGKEQPVFIIAEAGVNHNGSIDLALQLVAEAARCGADAIKFQTFKAERVVTREAPKAEYQLQTTNPTESQIEMLRKLELSPEDYTTIQKACLRQKIIFLSTPYSVEDIDLLDQLGVPAFKVASGQIVEPDFLYHVASKGKPVILSTGMATLAEVDEGLRTIRKAGNNEVIILQCTTNYPSRIEDSNLHAMQTIAKALRVLVGYSDHTETDTACMAAVALGAYLIEKHFTLDRTLPGPDQSCSADPTEFRRLVHRIRETELALGSSLKQPTKSEQRNALHMRRSIVSAAPIPSGTVITKATLTFKRPGTGIPLRIRQWIPGCRISRNVQPYRGELDWTAGSF